MRKISLTLILSLLFCCTASAWNLQDILGGIGSQNGSNQDQTGQTQATDILGGLLGDILSTSDFDIASLQGTWTVTGPAVTVNSDNALANLGGKAATAAIEAKLQPYYQRYGLTGSTITFDKEGKFTLKIKKLTVTGTVSKTQDGFQTVFNGIGSISLPAMKTYLKKGTITGKNLSVMWDSSKAMNLLQSVASYMKSSQTIQTLAQLLDKYQGLYIGFALQKK